MAKKTDSELGNGTEKRGLWQRIQGFAATPAPAPQVQVLKSGIAQRVVFFYPGEEGTYIENPRVTLYENGMVHIQSPGEETSTHLQNCEILWRFETEAEDPEKSGKVRLLKMDSKGNGTREKSTSQSPEVTE